MSESEALWLHVKHEASGVRLTLFATRRAARAADQMDGVTEGSEEFPVATNAFRHEPT
jgi:hypothetical protein